MLSKKVDYPAPIRELVQQLRRMPGIGPRSAERIALWMVQTPDARPQEVAAAIAQTAARVRACVRCGFFAEQELCQICADPGRDQQAICVVERATDILFLERTGAFNGLYHTLGGRLSPLDRIGPEDLTFNALLSRVRQDHPQEVILALGADVEGEATASYAADLLATEGVKVSRLAQGMPAGLGLENADDLTIARAFRGRTAFAN
ncbi:MAG TPA: recombination mediator RecR [Chthoniobacterales bacterium]